MEANGLDIMVSRTTFHSLPLSPLFPLPNSPPPPPHIDEFHFFPGWGREERKKKLKIEFSVISTQSAPAVTREKGEGGWGLQ